MRQHLTVSLNGLAPVITEFYKLPFPRNIIMMYMVNDDLVPTEANGWTRMGCLILMGGGQEGGGTLNDFTDLSLIYCS